jgi:basic membrane protein A and related proteins
MKKLLLSAAVIAVAMGSAAASANAADKMKACWVYLGAIGDFGWTYQHNEGRKQVEAELGDKVETVYVENVAEADSAGAIERLARDGCKIIFTTSFGYMEPTLEVAAKYPDVKFEHATGYKGAPNVTTYNAKFHQARYVEGQVAAKMSKTGVAGYIVSFPIPEVVAGINAFMLGAQSVNPDFKVKIVWANTWFDPGKEGDAAKVLFSQGADIMVQHTDSAAPITVAEEQGKLGFGQASDQVKFGPKSQLTAAVDNWGPYYVRRVKAVMDGSWKAQSSWDGMAEGTVMLAPFTNMPDDVAKMAAATAADIASGKLDPFGGKITKQDGTVVDKVDDGMILGMNWYVKGIDDQLPK